MRWYEPGAVVSAFYCSLIKLFFPENAGHNLPAYHISQFSLDFFGFFSLKKRYSFSSHLLIYNNRAFSYPVSLSAQCEMIFCSLSDRFGLIKIVSRMSTFESIFFKSKSPLF